LCVAFPFAVAYCAIFLKDGSYKTIQISESIKTITDVVRALLSKVNSVRDPVDFRLVGTSNLGGSSRTFRPDEAALELTSPVIVR
jgi:hypothetical protein